ncbi:MAG: hypothetical protein H7141_02625 [Burkholderiales bacterium]|nr:hypothetical protein [Bacteroidia bacterium]
MKTFIKIIAIALATISLTSCKEDYSELIQKIETTQLELQKEDSTLTTQRNEIARLVYTNTSNSSEAVSPKEMALTTLAGQQNTLITRVEILMQKNKGLIDKLNGSSVNPEEIYNEYKVHADELELMKTDINTAKKATSYS